MEFPILPPDAFETPDEPVTFQSEDVDFSLPDEMAVSEWLQQVAAAEKKPFHEVNYIFCSDDYLLQVNIEYLNHDYYTDIITFQMTEGMVHGDIFISIDRVRENAAANQVSFEHELHRVMVHGVLHLAGYGDKSPEEEQLMRQKEDFYLARFTV